MKKILIELFCALMLSSTVYADVIIISNKKGPPDSLTASEIREIIHGKMKKWDNGQKILFVTMVRSDVHKEFIRKFTRKSAAEFKNYWKKMLFTGRGIPPKSFKSEKQVIEYVAKNKGAIGYISSVPGTDEIKIISISDN